MKKKIVIYIATQSIHRVEGGVNWMKIGKNFNLNSRRLSSCRHSSTVGRAGRFCWPIYRAFFVSASLI
jgi:hypothetical protein